MTAELNKFSLEELGKGFEIVKNLQGLKVMLDINDLE